MFRSSEFSSPGWWRVRAERRVGRKCNLDMILFVHKLCIGTTLIIWRNQVDELAHKYIRQTDAPGEAEQEGALDVDYKMYPSG